MAISAASCGDRRDASSQAASLDLRPAREFRAFPLYYAGFRAGDKALSDDARSQLAVRQPNGQISFIYGTCEPAPGADDSGCGAPLSVSNVPSCAKNPALYGRNPAVRRTRLRGVPAWIFIDNDERFSRIELYSRFTTVVVDADSEEVASQVVRQLRAVNRPITTRSRLPAPRASDLAGTAPCRSS